MTIGALEPVPAQVAQPLLEVRGMTKRFGGVHALENVSLVVRPREIFGLIGPNGAGKSTLFAAISGFVSPDTGQVVLAGRDVTNLLPHERCRLGLGRTFQAIRLVEEMSVLETVLAGCFSRGRARLPDLLRPSRLDRDERQEALRRSVELLRTVGLWEKRHQGARDLAYGEQRRLEIARALAGEPTILMLDEPTAGMNQDEVGGVMQFISALRDAGQTILLIEHNVGLITRISDRVAVLESGRKIAEGTPAEIQRHPEVIRAYLGTAEGRDAAPAADPVRTDP